MIPRAKLDDIDEAVIQQLIDDEVRESRTLDFKAQLDLTREGKQALAEDVCAFANTVGGDLVFGLTAPEGTADEIQPVVVENLDEELMRLTSFLRDATEPRVTTALLSHTVPLAAGGHIVVLRVYPSPNAPHRVIRNGQFYLRNSVSKEPMDIHAIRTAFAHAEGLAERVRQFRDARLAALRERRAQVPVPPGPLLAVHLIPVLSLTRHEQHTVEDLKAAGTRLARAMPNDYGLSAPVTNVEGVICTSNRDAQRQHFAFAQLFRDGCIELAGALTADQRGDPNPIIEPAVYERALVHHDLPAAIDALARLGIPAPAYLSLSVINAHDVRVGIGARMFPGDIPTVPAHLNTLVSPLVYVDDFGVSPVDLARSVIDVVWNAVGIDHSRTNFEGVAR